MPKGDILLITFPFTDLSGNKLRPAVVLAETAHDFTVAFITSQLGKPENSDLLLTPNQSNRLRRQSLLRVSKIATLDKRLAKGVLGQLSADEEKQMNLRLLSLLSL